MKFGMTLIIVTALCMILSCSGDESKKKSPKAIESNIKTESKIPTPNAINSQTLKPDLHISGTKNTHISGITSTSEHISGQ